ncbi:hypothetical protein HY449_02810 [Candidatus Pacearchaeota archaeon]|nr:hypothetical protein [Candidatus Pacearchaeota archaeon]
MDRAFGGRIEDWAQLYLAHCFWNRGHEERVTLDDVYNSLDARYTKHCPFPNDAKLRDAVKIILEQNVDTTISIDYQNGHKVYVFSKDPDGGYFDRRATFLEKVTNSHVILKIEFDWAAVNIRNLFRGIV